MEPANLIASSGEMSSPTSLASTFASSISSIWKEHSYYIIKMVYTNHLDIIFSQRDYMDINYHDSYIKTVPGQLIINDNIEIHYFCSIDKNINYTYSTTLTTTLSSEDKLLHHQSWHH